MACSMKTTATLATGMKASPCALCSRMTYTTKSSVPRRANLSLAPSPQLEEPRRREGVCNAQKAPEGIARTVDTMLKRYDFVSTGVGALCVTGYFHYVHGQAPLEALSITAVSTIAALVVNELFFNDKH